ncbi:type ISP restriction/modification enzyme [Methyloglobulus sp.]|uniref:type ISP restriction/modification enzyme n=1 Tax=Methyloglobulus sp. TaxID=2518622 RepID=UPI0032B7E4A3
MPKPLADVYHLDIYGLRKDKYQTLLDNSINTLPWNKIECRAPEYFFVAKDFGVYGQYQQGFSVNELFPVNSSGIKTHRDDFVVDIDKNTLSNRIESFYSSSATNKDLQSKLALNEKEEWVDEKRRGIFNKNNIKQIHYRPFDSRSIYYSSELIERGREKVMQHFLKGENVGLLAGRQAVTDNWSHIQVTNTPIDNRIHYSNKGISVAFPLYLYPETTGQQSLQETSTRQPNLNSVIVQQIAEKLGLTFTPEKSTVIPAGMRVSSDRDVDVSNPWTLDSGNPCRNDVPLEDVHTASIREPGKPEITPSTFAPIDLLDYIYAVLHSPNYRESYKEFLKTDFPRVPYPDPHTFWPLVKLGGELRQLHLLESPAVNNPITTYPMDGDNTVTRKINQHDFTVRPELVEGHIGVVHGSTGSPRTAENLPEIDTELCGKVWINDQQYFDSVPKIAWEFYIGGYQPAQKWLKDRHGRTLSFEDILHYQKIIVVLTETHRIMQEIDTVR